MIPISGMSRPAISTSGLTRSLENRSSTLKKMKLAPKAQTNAVTPPMTWAVNCPTLP